MIERTWARTTSADRSLLCSTCAVACPSAMRSSMTATAIRLATSSSATRSERSARSRISEAYDALHGSGAEPDAELDPEAEPEALEMPEPDPAAVAELRKKEIALAVADRTCQEESGYAKAYRTALRAAEEEIWEKYGDELEAAAAAASASASPKE